MGGGLMQLVAYGAQDIYLTGNPQITFFKVVYRRHTNFSIEAIEQTFTGSVDFGRKLSCTIDRNGDLLGKMYLEICLEGLSTTSALPAKLGHALIKEVEVNIGGQCVDKHYGEWLELWSQLTCSSEQLTKLRTMIGGSLDKVYVPLQFWFNRNPGLALPLIALQYHEVKLNVVLSTKEEVGFAGSEKISEICLYCDYIFLDTDERRRFAQVSHEYLIEQLQFNNIVSVGATESSSNVDLRLNHPCKELVWVVDEQLGDPTTPKANFDWSSADEDCLGSATLQLNGHERFRTRDASYFRCVQPYQHHTGGQNQGSGDGFFYVYSFALKPEEHQPSGTCNFSRIDNAVLQLNGMATGTGSKNKHVKVYATNYNVLRVMSGMGGLAYSN